MQKSDESAEYSLAFIAFFASSKEYVVPSFAQAPWAQRVSTQQLQCGGTDANAAVVNDKV